MGVISTRSVRKFNARARNDFSELKKLKVEQLAPLYDKLVVKPPIYKKLSLHQKVMFLLGALHSRCAFFADTGMGKTLLSIALMRYFIKAGLGKHYLVLVPNKSNKTAWAMQFEEHSPRTKFKVLKGSSVTKFEALMKAEYSIYIDTYAGFVRMVSDMKEDKRRKAKSKQRRLMPNVTKLRKMRALFDGVFADESTYMANKTKLPFRVVRQLLKPHKGKSKVFIPMTATPFGRDPVKLWAQIFLVDDGYTLGETLGLFRAAFYNADENSWGGQDYTFDKKKSDTLHKFLNHCSITYEVAEGDLPEVIYMKKYAVLDGTAESYYEKAKRALMEAQGDYLATKNSFLRMRQISGGYIGYNDNEKATKAQFVFPEQPKLDLLEEALNEISPKYKVIVFHEYRFSGKLICKRLREMGIDYLELNGGTKDEDQVMRDFKSDKSKRVLVLSNSAGGFGLNMQHARYGIYYEAPVSPIIRRQTARRWVRQFSKFKRVVMIDLIVRGTADERILEFHEEGQSMWKAILKHGAKQVLVG